MKVYLPNQPDGLTARIMKQVSEPFNAFLPMANICQYSLQNGQLLLQELSSELYSIVIYEAILNGEQHLEIEFPESLISLFFTLQGSITVQQENIPRYTQEAGKYILAYSPAGIKLNVGVPNGRTMVFRVDFKHQPLQELSEDYLIMQTMLREAEKGSPFSRRLYSAAIDPFVKLSIRQIFEYGETKSERSLFIYARCIDLLRHYIHSIHPQQWDKSNEEYGAIAQVIKVADYIDQHLDRPLLKGDLAKMHNLSVRSLERHFLHYYRQSIGKFILTRRMTKAQELLKETSSSVFDIALLAGYSELTNFSRAFKAFFGYLPSHLRK